MLGRGLLCRESVIAARAVRRGEVARARAVRQSFDMVQTIVSTATVLQGPSCIVPP